MTGIERLREFVAGISPDIAVCGVTKMSYDREHMEEVRARLRDFLSDIADQIEREQGGRVSRMRVLSVVTEMERHVSGVEGAEDSPVARWARELREALDAGHDHAADVSVSAYDLLPQEDRDAIAWVRERGGIESVKAKQRESMPRAAYERKKAGFLDHIAECETALGRRRETISELNHRACDLTRENAELRKRAMPEGMCWPVFEDGKPVRIGGCWGEDGCDTSITYIERIIFAEDGVYLDNEYNEAFYRHGERVKRPAPKVLDADGVEIRVGDTVWPRYPSANRDAQVERAEVAGIQAKYGRVDVRTVYATGLSFLEQVDADRLTHRAPVLAADGRPLREGETVWDMNGDELVIGALEDGGHTVTCRYVDVGDAIPVHGMWSPSQLTHQRPVADTWERLEEDTRMSPSNYCLARGLEDTGATYGASVQTMRAALRAALRCASRPEPDWDGAARALDKVNELSCELWQDCVRESWRKAMAACERRNEERGRYGDR